MIHARNLHAGRAILALVLMTTGTVAQTQTTSDKAQAQTQFEMNAIAARDYRDADAALNDVWGRASTFAHSIDRHAELLAAQRAWLAYRDAACTAHAAPFEGGSMQPMVVSACLTQITEERTRMLAEFHGY
jgi:uncharacterized protein YecT (DUF1311 family)